MQYIYITLTAALLAFGLLRVSAALLFRDRYNAGGGALRKIAKWQKPKRDLWDSAILVRFCEFAERFVYLDDTARESLERRLSRAGMSISPERFTARKFVILGGAGVAAIVCVLARFWVGVILCVLVAIYGMMRQRELLESRIKERDAAIALEMPRFVRTLCRTLRTNRDIYAALASYKKVAGRYLLPELNTLLMNMSAGNTASALQQFQKRIGTDSAFRLCSTLQEIDRGIDQTATLDYLADDMARQSKIDIQKTLAVRPGKMRMTYLPAVGVCVGMILYVLIVFVTEQLNNLF